MNALRYVDPEGVRGLREMTAHDWTLSAGHFTIRDMPRRYNNFNRYIKALGRSLRNPKREPRPQKEGRSRRQRRTEARLARLPVDRRCPRCSQVILEPNRWYLPAGKGEPYCRACRAQEQVDEQGRTGRSRSERRAAARLAALPSDRHCPVCEDVVLEPRRWYVGSEGVCCLSCRRSGRGPLP